jgi:hypothetical protein
MSDQNLPTLDPSAVVAPEHIGEPTGSQPDADMPTAGRAVVHTADWPSGPGPMIWFKCPRDRLYCGVPAKPSPPNSKGCSWDWNGDRVNPSLTPSVNCVGGCGWHGHITNGEIQ